METILQESKLNSESSADLDNFRSRYIEFDLVLEQSAIYPAAELYSLEKNFYLLLAASKQVDFDVSWTMRPDYASFDQYQSVIYWPILMFVNGIDTMEQFRGMDKLYVPPIDLMIRVIYDKVPRRKIERAGELPRSLDPKFMRYPFDSNEIEAIKADDQLNTYNQLDGTTAETTTSTATILTEETEYFTLTQTDLTNMYIDLAYDPINKASISLFVDFFTVPQKYGYDYSLILNDTSTYGRISWSPSQTYGGNGTLNNILIVGTELRVVYIMQVEVE